MVIIYLLHVIPTLIVFGLSKSPTTNTAMLLFNSLYLTLVMQRIKNSCHNGIIHDVAWASVSVDTRPLTNVRSATFEEKIRVIKVLDVKVYPSENLDHMGVTCAVNLAGLEGEGKPTSCYNTNIASPKL